MNRYEVFEYITEKRICVLLATSIEEAWSIAESHGWYPNNYYII